MKIFLRLSFIVFLFITVPFNLYSQSITYKKGNGIHISSVSNEWDFLFSGYINTIFAYHSIKQNGSIDNSFYVHRARLDLGFDYNQNYSLFFEFDAAGQRTAMVLAQVQAKLFNNNYLIAGKFIDPFSDENNRSTSRLTTIERYSGLNSIFLLPGLDTQYGLMFWGSNQQKNIEYFISVTNGNGEAGQNISENNNSKNITGRLNYKFSDVMKIGGSVSYANEQPQVLSLLDHTFESFNNSNVLGNRIGYLANFEYGKNEILFRGEAFDYNFSDALSMNNQLKSFTGGYIEAGCFITGNNEDGVQLIGRFETSRYGKTFSDFKGPTLLNSYIIGANWLKDNIFSYQINLIYEKANRNNVLTSTRLEAKEDEVLLLSTFQLRF